MYTPNDPLEVIWDGLLSHEPDQIRTAFVSLDHTSQKSVLLHLNRMAREPGWFPAQQQSAQFALDILTPGLGDDILPID